MAKYGDELRRRVYGSAKPSDKDIDRVRKQALTVDPVTPAAQATGTGGKAKRPTKLPSTKITEGLPQATVSATKNAGKPIRGNDRSVSKAPGKKIFDENLLSSAQGYWPTERVGDTRGTIGSMTTGGMLVNPRVEELNRFLDVHDDKVYKDGFGGQFSANYALGRADNEASKAWAIYMDDPTEENRKIAEGWDSVARNLRANNKAPLDDQGEVLPWISRTLASNLPQTVDQTLAQGVGGLIGAGLAGTSGAKIGASVASGAQSYDAMRGAAFKRLLDLGVDEKTARDFATDEGIINAMIEGGDTYLDWLMLGTSGAVKKLLPGLASKATTAVGKSALGRAVAAIGKTADKIPTAARAVGGWALNIPQEGGEEGWQEGVSLAVDKAATSGRDVGLWELAKDSVKEALAPENREQVTGAAKEGMKYAALLGGGQALVSHGAAHLAGRADAPKTRAGGSTVDGETNPQYNQVEKTASPAAAPQVQQMEEQAQVTRVENPESDVLDAATTLFVQQGMKLKTAQDKAGVVHRLVRGEDVSVRDINKLNPTSKESQRIFTELTGVQFPDGKLSTEQLYNLYRSASTVAVQAQAQQAVQATATQMAAEEQVSEMEGADALRMAQEEIARQAEMQEWESPTSLEQQMAESGFQANPETQARIAQAQAELNDAVNGTTTAASVKTGAGRNSIALSSGNTLTRSEFKQAAQSLYSERGAKVTDSQLDAMFNNFLAVSDHGGDLSALEAVADYLKEESANVGEPFVAGPLGQGEREAGTGNGQRDTRGERSPGGQDGPTGRPVGESQEEAGASAEDRQGADRGGAEDQPARAVYAEDAVRPDPRSTGERRGSGEVRGGGQEASGDGVLREVRGEPGRETESGESVNTTIRRLAKHRAEMFRKKNYPTQKMDVGTGAENDILPEKYWSRDLKRVAAKVRAAGGEFYATVGAINYHGADGTVRKADGLTIPSSKVVLVRADSSTKLPGQIGGHELLHLYMVDDVTLLDRLRYRVLGALGDTSLEDFDASLKDSYAVYEACYGDFEENYDLYLAEFLCDLNGDVRSRVHTSDATFDLLRSLVVKTVQQWESQMPDLHTEENSTNQRQTGGPSFALTTDMTWDEQLDTLDDHRDYNALYIEETPNILAEVGLGNLPLSMTKAHMRDILHPKDKSNAHWHGVPEGVIRNLPELLSRPAMILRSNTVKGDIVVVLQATDSDGNPIVATIRPNGTAYVDGKVGPANFITSVYGRDNFASRSGETAKNNFLYLALRNRSILYWNEKRTEALAHRSRLQLPQTLRKVPPDTIINQYDGYVKGNAPKRLFSLGDEDTDDFGPAPDTGVPKFNSWSEAYFYLDGLADANVIFSNPPGFEDTMELGLLDSHGNWYETVGEYDATPEGLSKFNEEIGEILSTYSISDEELNALFPPDEWMHTYDDFVDDQYESSPDDSYEDDYAEAHSVGEYDVPPDPDRANLEGEWEVQQNRDGFTNTESKAFKKWFHDDTGELTNSDGKPKVFLRGSVGMGATKAHDSSVANSGGIFFTTSPSIAVEYGQGASVDDGMTLMDAVKGSDNIAAKELKLKYFRGWGPAKDYILRNFQARGNGLRLVGKDTNGNQTDLLSQTAYFSLQTNLNTEGGFRANGDFAGGTWRELAAFPKTKSANKKSIGK